jgi:DNA-binding phage protein
MDEPSTWEDLKPRLESVAFRSGLREVARESGVCASTIYRLISEDSRPQPRTLRDLDAAVDRLFSRSQHPDE